MQSIIKESFRLRTVDVNNLFVRLVPAVELPVAAPLAEDAGPVVAAHLFVRTDLDH